MAKLKNIELLRIIGCIAVVMIHICGSAGLYANFDNIPLYSNLHLMTLNGQKAVDLFFILSGFFFVYTFKNVTLWKFIKSKIIRLFPVLIFIVVLSFVIHCFGFIQWNYYDNLFAILGLNGSSLVIKRGMTAVEQFWYVSAMLWVLCLFLYLIKNYEKKTVNLIIFLTVFFCYSFLIHAKDGAINNSVQTFYYIFNVGMMRALGGIGLGCLIGEWYKNNFEKIRGFVCNIYQKTLFTIMEFCCLYFIINNLTLHKIKYNNDMIFILAFTGIIILFLTKKGYISQILNDTKLGDIFTNLAKYTYSIYMLHILVRSILVKNYWINKPTFIYQHPVLHIILIFTVVIAGGILIYHFVEKPCINYFKNKAQTGMVVERERERERVMSLLDYYNYKFLKIAKMNWRSCEIF